MDLLTHINSQDENIICETMNLGQDKTPIFQHIVIYLSQLFCCPGPIFSWLVEFRESPAGLALLLRQSWEESLGTKG